MNRLQMIEECGQSIWLDAISRDLLRSGALQRMIHDDGLRGVTSNPAIFEKAITSGTDYDDAIEAKLRSDAALSDQALYEALAIDDIRDACDLLRTVFEATTGADGYVSLEVSPHLAHDAEGTVSEARRLWRAVDRPNLMIKIPATRAGITAVEDVLADGINVNVTLIFSMAHYEASAAAYMRGAARCGRPQRLASVASLFVSRLDTAVDPLLERIGTHDALSMRGRIAVANARLVYRRYRALTQGPAFDELRRRGVPPQRLLWGSTGTKNRAYSDVLYVENLIGHGTVNTVPLDTLDAFRDHGVARITADAAVEQAEADMKRLRALGIDLEQVFDTLQREGLDAFTRAYDRLLGALAERGRRVKSAMQ